MLFASGLLSEQPYSPQDFILYSTVISVPLIIVLLLLLRYLCGENLRDLNLKPGKWTSDLLAAIILSVVTLAANVLSTSFLSELLPASPPNTAVINLFGWLSRNPGMFAPFLGVLLWIGVAQEEITRVFLLSRLWKVWPSAAGASELGTVWTDPDFDPKQSAFYYARVLEIPTPRWVVYDAFRYGIEIPEEAETTHQERAYTSPIWYSP